MANITPNANQNQPVGIGVLAVNQNQAANPVQNAQGGGDMVSQLFGFLGGGNASTAENATGAAAGAAKGGADPVSAIANAVGSIFGFANTVQSGKNNRNNAIYESRSFKQFYNTNTIGTPTATTPSYVGLYILGAVALMVFLLLIFKRPQ